MRVIKLGGRIQADPVVLDSLADIWRRSPRSLCIVHGGGDEISSLQERLGATASFTGGRRVTTAADIDIVRMALSGLANKRIVSELVSRGVRALGVSGEDASLLVARPLDVPQLGQVGVPSEVNAALLRWMLAGEILPVISPLSAGALDAAALNVNGDDAAAAIAAALGADELFFLADVPGVLADGVAITDADEDEALELIEHGAATGGMAAKLEAAINAVRQGVARVRIGDVSALATGDGGTLVTPVRSLV